ncbi:FAD-binding protein [uncultured Slackia sp.]|uniref:FAD-binding protein n=1 Tax=uncultured Slackia sp. TaxID=665903 RepID=UPI0025E6686A|nr:FAD-binding protein [uncultured Slackia sp.]
MHIESESSFDVVVVGGGIAGCCAAIEAARAGASVCLASASGVFSGSSFYPGTWGLGLVGPRDASDIDDMVEAILHVGRGVANAALVESFVRGIPEAIAALEAMGVSLKRPANPDEPQYIPCFDHSLRMWRGLERDSMKRGIEQALCEGGVVRFDRCELLDIAMDDGRVRGALFFDHSAKRFRAVSCGAIVLAGGGVAGLYKRSLSASGNSATVQALAARCGARLVNLEFMQIMPGLVSPRRNIVFNEKAFRFARARDASGKPIARDVLEARSEHGPFSCERAGAPLDFAMEACGDEGMEITCDVGDGSPEFVRTFSEWLERECGVSASAPARIAPYAHASNGGIAIDEHGACGVPGLFAAGECTGGMHGADRIGGLASANALVFGRRAGVAAAKFASRNEFCDAHSAAGFCFPLGSESVSFEIEERAYSSSSAILRELRETMSAHCMISRDAEGLKAAASAISALQARVEEPASASGLASAAVATVAPAPMAAPTLTPAPMVASTPAAAAATMSSLVSGLKPEPALRSAPSPASEHVAMAALTPSSDAASIAATMRIRLQLETASAAVAAMLARKESCGSHYRSDAVL